MKRDPRLQKQATTSLSISTEETSFPSDCRSIISLYHDGDTYFGPLGQVTPSQLGELKGIYGTQGAPEYYAVVNRKVRVCPTPDQAYTLDMVYDQELTSLSDSAPTNWLITDHPDVYLYSALLEAEPFLKNDERLSMWAEMRERVLEELDLARKREEFGGRIVSRPTRPIGG